MPSSSTGSGLAPPLCVNPASNPVLGTHQDVIGFDVSMQDASSLHQLQRQKQLLAIAPHGLDVKTVKTDILAVPLEHLSPGSCCRNKQTTSMSQQDKGKVAILTSQIWSDGRTPTGKKIKETSYVYKPQNGTFALLNKIRRGDMLDLVGHAFESFSLKL